MRLWVLTILFALSGCIGTAELKEVKLFDGTSDLVINCVGDIFYEHQCVDKAKERCPEGYSVVSDTRSFQYISLGYDVAVQTTRHYVVRCGQEPKKSSS